MMSMPRRNTRALLAIAGCLLFGCLGVGVSSAFAVEVPVTGVPSGVGGTVATFGGVVNPGVGVEGVAYRFAYSAGSGAACTESGLVVPVGPPFPEVVGNDVDVSEAVTGLEGSTEYAVCLIAANPLDEEEVAQGNSVTFVTDASAPVLVSGSATPVSPFSEVLEGSVNPEVQETTYHLEYADNSSFTGATALAYGIAGPGVSGAQTVGPVEVAGLAANTTYYYRVVAKNATGETKETKEFTTASTEAPRIESEPGFGEENGLTVGHTTATLTAFINPGYQETTCDAFEYGLTEGYGLEVPCSPEGLGGGGGGEFTTGSLTGLTANTEYHYQVVATNTNGTSEGKEALGDKTFLTLPEAPTASTGSPSAATGDSATVTGIVDPGATGHSEQDDTSYYFEYGGTPAYGHQTAVVEAGDGTAAKRVEAVLGGLEPGFSYHYRIVASNVNGVSGQTPQLAYGNDEPVTTVSLPPSLSSVSVSGVTQTSATINATLQTEGLPTRYELQVGTTPGLLQPQSAGNTTTPAALVLPVSSLTPGTTYYYTLTAINADDTKEPIYAHGSFTTSAAPAPALAGLPALIPYTPIAVLDAQEAAEAKKTQGSTSHPLTKAQKLARALKACKKDKTKSKRTACQKQAHKRYPAKKKSTK